MNCRNHRVGGGLAVLLAASTLISCFGPPFAGSFRPWSGSAVFVKSLRCKMTEAEIEATAQRFPPLEVRRSNLYPGDLTVQKGDTLIFLGLRDSRLETYRISWVSGFTKRSSRLKYNLCSGDKYVEVHLVGSSDLAGAKVWMNGEVIGQLSVFGTFGLDVQLGSHKLRVEKAGGGSWSTELRYDESSSGYDRVPITEDEFGQPAPDS